MASPLSKLVDNLPKEFIKSNVSMDMITKNVKNVKSNRTIVGFYLRYVNVKGDLIA